MKTEYKQLYTKILKKSNIFSRSYGESRMIKTVYLSAI